MKMNNSAKFFLRSGRGRKEARVDLRNRLRTEKYCNAGHSHQGSSTLKFSKGKDHRSFQVFKSGERETLSLTGVVMGGSQEAAAFSTKTENIPTENMREEYPDSLCSSFHVQTRWCSPSGCPERGSVL